MTENEFDAAQRTIEADSFLMGEFMHTDKRLSISKRIEYIFIKHIKCNKAMYQKYLEILEGIKK